MIMYEQSEKIFDIGSVGWNCRGWNWCRYNFFNDFRIIFTIENITTINKEY